MFVWSLVACAAFLGGLGQASSESPGSFAPDTARPVWNSGMLKEAAPAPEGLRAVTEKTLILSGRHALRTESSFLPEKMGGFSISAWVRPESFDPYNEIFRIESSEGRVLFSFQEKGSVLSLGLDANGYQECDAAIRPESMLDGCWHFAAATFDGKKQRVFVDGAQVAEAPLAGAARVARAAGFVGSLEGNGEFFQGGLDDLRLYTEALTPEALAAVFKAGAARVAARAMTALPAEWKPFLQERPTFAATLREAREMLRRNGRECPPNIRNLFAMKLAARFSKECANYARLYGQAPVSFLLLPDLNPLKARLGEQIERRTEYMPLTEAQ